VIQGSLELDAQGTCHGGSVSGADSKTKA
jgi:hypothetical protein